MRRLKEEDRSFPISYFLVYFFPSFFVCLLSGLDPLFPFIGFSTNKLITNKSIDSPKENRHGRGGHHWNRFTQSEVIKKLLSRTNEISPPHYISFSSAVIYSTCPLLLFISLPFPGNKEFLEVQYSEWTVASIDTVTQIPSRCNQFTQSRVINTRTIDDWNVKNCIRKIQARTIWKSIYIYNTVKNTSSYLYRIFSILTLPVCSINER